MAGYVDNADDCDDFDSARSPAFTEISCDGVDNDCMMSSTSMSFPATTARYRRSMRWPTTTWLFDGGTYVESVDVWDADSPSRMAETRPTSSLRSARGRSSRSTTGTRRPTRPVPRTASSRCRTSRSRAGLGDRWSVQGAFLGMRGGDASVRNVVFDGISVTADDNTVSSGLIHSRGMLTVDAVSVSDLSYDLSSGPTAPSCWVDS